MIKSVIAVDVDLTIVDTLTPWLDWFEFHTGGGIVMNEDNSYNLVPEMKRIIEQRVQQGLVSSHFAKHFDPMDYWREPTMYDYLAPMPDSVHALSVLKDQGNHIIFVSLCEPSHIHSKLKFLERYFPFMDAFIDTSHKHFVRYDKLIDDRLSHLELGSQFNPAASHILFTGVREDGLTSPHSYKKINSWHGMERM